MIVQILHFIPIGFLMQINKHIDSWWLNHPFEKYARQIGSWNPRDPGENSKNVDETTT